MTNQATRSKIAKLRTFVQDSELRFFLALLTNDEAKSKIFSIMNRRFPKSDPMEKILDWVFDLARTRVFGVNVPNALGIESFDEFDLIILEYLLKDLSGDEICAELQRENQGEEIPRENLLQRIDKLKNAVIFEPLFA